MRPDISEMVEVLRPKDIISAVTSLRVIGKERVVSGMESTNTARPPPEVFNAT